MKRGLIAASVVAALSVLGTVTLATASAKPIKLTCGLRLVVAIPPGFAAPPPGALSGNQFGLASCPLPAGSGVDAQSFTVAPATRTVTGAYKLFFNTGTAHGTYKLSFAPGPITTYTGTLKIAGGTGRFRLIKGHGTVHCTSPDGGVHVSCTAHLAITRI